MNTYTYFFLFHLFLFCEKAHAESLLKKRFFLIEEEAKNSKSLKPNPVLKNINKEIRAEFFEKNNEVKFLIPYETRKTIYKKEEIYEIYPNNDVAIHFKIEHENKKLLIRYMIMQLSKNNDTEYEKYEAYTIDLPKKISQTSNSVRPFFVFFPIYKKLVITISS